jgi:Ras-related protein Rab-11A
MNEYDKEADFLFKLVLVGDSSVGKSNLLLRKTKNEFNLNSVSTMGVEFAITHTEIENSNIKTQIWDTAGQDRFKALSSAYYRGSYGALLIYDITKKSTFSNIDKWLKEVKEHTSEDTEILLVGNKCDLESLRSVSVEEGLDYAKKHNFSFIETSALDSTNVELAFFTLINQIYNKCKYVTPVKDENESIITLKHLEEDKNSEKVKCVC